MQQNPKIVRTGQFRLETVPQREEFLEMKDDFFRRGLHEARGTWILIAILPADTRGSFLKAAMNKRLKLMLLIPHLGGGGAERVVAQLARSLDPELFDTHLVLITQDQPGAEAMPAWVTVYRFECKRVRNGCRRLLHLLWEERPDVLFSGMAHLSFVVLLLRPVLPRQTRVIVRQNTTASRAALGWVERFCYRSLYPRADAIVCQSEAMAADLTESFEISERKIEVLRNPVDLIRHGERVRAAEKGGLWPQGTWPRLLSVGRLSSEKGFDLLLEAMSRLQSKYPRIHAIVLGEGQERDQLEWLCKELDLADAVSFPGFCGELAEFYAQADLFVLPSRYEGMPNALLEAAAWGLPLAATPCSGGVAEILQATPGAWLSASITAECLADAISSAVEVLADSTDPGKESRRFEYAFLAQFETGIAVAGYAELFQKLGDKAKGRCDV